MPMLKVIPPDFKDGRPVSACQTRVLLDGKPLKSVTSLDLRFAWDEIVSAKIELYPAVEPIEVPANVQVTVAPPPCAEWGVEVEERSDGTKVIRYLPKNQKGPRESLNVCRKGP